MRDLPAPRSTPSRDRSLRILRRRTWDLVVVGGGASGAAAARDAALRGLQTALVEQADFAHGTSSRSSRLVHGGLRYLAEYDFKLVREGLVERRRLLEAAPGLVQPVDFLYPVFDGDPDPLWKVALGVRIYELLALGYGLGGQRRLAAGAVRRMAPALAAGGLRGAVLYRDAATHDARLTLSLVLAAQAAGAVAVPRCRTTGLLESGGRIAGVEVEDRIGGGVEAVAARAVLVCTGPWQELFGGSGLRLRTARGSHLSFPAERLRVPCDVALRVPEDGRLAFALPMDGHTVLGTTDAFDSGPPADVAASNREVRYLLDFAAHAFPDAALSARDVVGAWAGLRPLVTGEEEESADAISREHRIVHPRPGLWILTGGKLTTHRSMAEECVDALASDLADAGVEMRRCRTRDRSLLTGSLAEGRRILAGAGVAPQVVDRLAGLYGDRLEAFAGRPRPPRGRYRLTAEGILERQVEMAVAEEHALALDDLLLRRLAPGPLDLLSCGEAAPQAARLMARRLGWTAQEEAEQVRLFRAGIEHDLAGVRKVAGSPEPPAATAKRTATACRGR